MLFIKNIIFVLLYFVFITISADETNKIDSQSWLSKINDNIKLSQLTIPGTHNSATQSIFISAGRCQEKTISEQLKLGIRAFDLRINEKMEICHGILKTDEKFINIIKEMINFLKINENEFILVSIKDENNNSTEEEWTATIQGILSRKEFNSYIYIKKPHNYSLKEIRGKIIFLYRYGNFPENGLRASRWKNNNITFNTIGSPIINIQDIYSPKNTTEKQKVIKKFLKLAKEEKNEKLWINFTSIAYKFLGATPYENAKIINPILLDYLNENPVGPYGIIMMDFPTETPNLIKKLINSNNFCKK